MHKNQNCMHEAHIWKEHYQIIVKYNYSTFPKELTKTFKNMSTIFLNFHLYSFSQLIFNIIQINVFSFSWSSQLTIVSRRDFFLSSCVQPISWSASSSISNLLPYPLLSQWLPTSYTQLQYNEKYSPPFFKLFKGTVLQDFVSLVYLTNMALLFICWSNFWHLVSISQSYSCAKNPTVSLYAAESKAPQCHVDTKKSDSAWRF